MTSLDDDAMAAAVDLVGRTGAKGVEIGYLNDDSSPDWYAVAQYAGAKVIEEHHIGPVEAAEALARRLLMGAKCRCGKLVALSDRGAIAYDTAMVDGSHWTKEDAAKAGQCRWTRNGAKWVSACGRGLPKGKQ